jgi:uncharacterized protein
LGILPAARASDDELLGERQGLSGSRFVERVGGTKRNPIDRYSFPPQDSDIHEGADMRLVGEGAGFGGVEAIDYAKGTVDIKKRGAQAEKSSECRLRLSSGGFRSP